MVAGHKNFQHVMAGQPLKKALAGKPENSKGGGWTGKKDQKHMLSTVIT